MPRADRLTSKGSNIKTRKPKLAKAGFDNIEIEPTRVYSMEDARTFLSGQGLDVDALAKDVEGKFISAFVRAAKPAGACCAADC